MGVKGKLVSQVKIKCEGDVFQHYKFPNCICDYMPHLVQGVDLLEGEWGTVGSVISWNYTQDGKKKTCKEIIEAIDDEKKSITFKVTDATDVLDSCNAFKIVLDVDSTDGGCNQVVTWTLEYEKKCESDVEPHAFMNYLIDEVKHIEANYKA